MELNDAMPGLARSGGSLRRSDTPAIGGYSEDARVERVNGLVRRLDAQFRRYIRMAKW